MADLDMVLDRVDDYDRNSGTVLRRAVFASRANFRVVHLFLFNTRGDLLLQKIAPGLRHEGFWGSSVAGYIASGDDYRVSMERRAREELGVASLPIVERGQTTMIDSGCKKFVTLFTASHDGGLLLNPADAAGIEFVPIGEIDDMVTRGTRRFTQTFLHVLDFYRNGATP